MTRRQLAALERRVEQARARVLAPIRILYQDDELPPDDDPGFTIVRAVDRPHVTQASTQTHGTDNRPDA